MLIAAWGSRSEAMFFNVNTPFIAYYVPQICPNTASTDVVAVAKNVTVTRIGDILIISLKGSDSFNE